MKQIRVARMVRGWTIWELGRRANVSVGRLSLLERGIVEPREDERRRLAKVLDGSPTSLFEPVCLSPGDIHAERGA